MKMATIKRLNRRENPRSRPKIFIVAHDRTLCAQLKKIITEDVELEAVVLQELPNMGARTIIEKFERYASECSYAIAILTPDDPVRDNTATRLRARPNVIFELGWFFSHLGRDRVMILRQDGVDLAAFSDIEGVLYISFDRDITEIGEQVKEELALAGVCPVRS
jgi:predicted nucleotide-binding protein